MSADLRHYFVAYPSGPDTIGGVGCWRCGLSASDPIHLQPGDVVARDAATVAAAPTGRPARSA